MEEKLIRLICAIDKVYDEYFCDCGFEDYVIEDFVDELNSIFNEKELDFDTLKYINGIDTKIFIDDFYMTKDLKNNEIRKQIAHFCQTTDDKIKPLFNVDLVLKYICQDYRLIHYLDKITEDDIVNLAIKNPKVLYLVDNITTDILIKIIKHNSQVALVIDCDIMKDNDLYENTFLYKNKKELLKNEELYRLYINGLKEYLNANILEYIYLSDFAKEDIDLASYVLNINPKLLVYVGENIRNNKEIMFKMLSVDKKDIIKKQD